MRPVILRFMEMMMSCLPLSIISCALFYFQIIVDTDKSYAFMLSIAFAAFVIVNVFRLRRCFWERPKFKAYYLYNYIAYAGFIVATIAAYKILGEIRYAWLFSALKLTAFMKVDHTTLEATMFSHFIMILVIAISPLDISYKINKTKDAFRS